MDVRCERCKAQYVFDDDQVTPSGLAVQCTNCGHLFRVKKKELVVTVPMKPGELDGAPVPADSLTGAYRLKPAAAPPPEPREWRVRQVGGNVLAFRELTTLQKWIVEGKVGREDQLSSGGDRWARLGDLEELATFFEIVDRARVAPPAASPSAGRTMPLYPRAPEAAVAPSPAPPAEVARPSPPPPRASAPPPPTRPPAVTPARAGQAPAPEPAARGGRGRMALFVAALALAAGAAAYVYAPQLLRRREETVTITLETIRAPAVEPGASAAPNPDPNPNASPTSTSTATGTPNTTGTSTSTPTPNTAATATPTPIPNTTADTTSTSTGRSTPAVTSTDEAAGIEARTGTETGKRQDREAADGGTAKPEELAAPSGPKAAAAGTKVAVVRGGPKALAAQAERLRAKGETSRALDLYGRVIAGDPENVPALTGRGLCYLDLSHYAPAAASFEAALALAPDDADALLGLAEAYRSQGRDADAVRYYERYLAKHPDGDEAAVAQNALQELRR